MAKQTAVIEDIPAFLKWLDTTPLFKASRREDLVFPQTAPKSETEPETLG